MIFLGVEKKLYLFTWPFSARIERSSSSCWWLLLSYNESLEKSRESNGSKFKMKQSSVSSKRFMSSFLIQTTALFGVSSFGDDKMTMFLPFTSISSIFFFFLLAPVHCQESGFYKFQSWNIKLGISHDPSRSLTNAKCRDAALPSHFCLDFSFRKFSTIVHFSGNILKLKLHLEFFVITWLNLFCDLWKGVWW